MLNPLDDLLVQKVILLMTGVPGTATMRNEFSQLLKEGDPSKVSAFIDDFMAKTPAHGKGADVALQFVLDSGFSMNLTPQKIDQLAADSLRQGIDSWSGLFSYMMNGLNSSVDRILSNRAEASKLFSDLVDGLGVEVNVNDLLVQEWIDEINASDESLAAAKNTVNGLIDQLTRPPILIESAPSDDSVQIQINQNIDLAFSKVVIAGSGNIIISSSDREDTRIIAVTDSSQVTIKDGRVTINPAADLLANKSYSILIASGVITDSAGRPFAGISDTTTLNFNTIDTIAPSLISSAPIDDATGILRDQDVSLVFSEAILAGIGNIIISSDDSSDIRTISVTDSSQVTITGNTLILNPTADLRPNTSYNVLLASGVITDFAGNAFAGIGDTTTLNFRTINTNLTTSEVTLAAIAEDGGTRIISQAELLSNASDVDGDTLTATGLAIASGSGALVDNLDGTWKYTPALNDDTAVSFSYAISDGSGGTALGSASLDITPVNDNPITSAVTLTAIAENSATRVITKAELLINATDPDNDVLTATGLAVASGKGILIDNLDGTWKYTPAMNDNTAVSFSYTISDGNGGTALGSASLDILPDVTPPVITTGDTAAAIDENSGANQVVYTVSSDDVAAIYSLSGDDAAAFSIDSVSGVVRLLADPDNESKSSYNFTVVATDLAGNKSDQVVNLAINEIPELLDHHINTYASNNQSDSSVIALIGGDFVVTWESFDQDGSGYGVYGQRYDASGAPLGREFQVNTTITNNQWYSSVGALTGGGFVVTWQSADQDGSGHGIFSQRYDVSGAPLGGEFQVNTATFSNQAIPSVTALIGGGFVVTWQSADQDGSGHGIFGQRYDVTGAPLGEEFQVNTTTTNDQQQSWYSPVAALTDGGFVVTWQSFGQDGSGYGIFGRRYDATGTPLGGEFQANTTTTNDQNTSSVTALTGGGYVVTWQSPDQDGSGYGIFGRRYDATDTPQGGEFQVNTTTTNDQNTSSVTALAGGGFVVTWQSSGQDGSGDDIFGRRYDATGTPLGGEFLINTYTTGPQYWASATALPDGGFLVTWSSEDQDGSGPGIFGKRYDANGGEVEWTGSIDTLAPIITSGDTAAAIDENSGANQVVYTVSSDDVAAIYSLSGDDASAFSIDSVAGVVRLLADPDNESKSSYNFSVAATDLAGNKSDKIVSLAINEIPEADDHRINTFVTDNQNNASVTALADGGFMVTWDSFGQDGSGYGIYGQRYAADGSELGAEFRINTYTIDDQNISSVTALADGGFVVTWGSNNQDGIDYGVYGQRYTADGSELGAEFHINAHINGTQWDPSVIGLADGSFIVTWDSFGQDGSGWGIYGQHYAVDGSELGAEFRINTYVSDNQSNSSVTALVDGSFVVTWNSENQDGAGLGIYGQRYDASGGALGAEFRINTYTADDQIFSSVTAPLAEGGFVVTWGSNSQDGSGWGIYGQRYDASGGALGAEFRINTYTADDQNNASVTALADGGFVVTWNSKNQDGAGWGIYGQRYSASGVGQGAEFRINTYNADDQDNTSVIGLADGGFVVTWESFGQDGSAWGIFGKRYDANGAEVEWSNGSTFTLTASTDIFTGASVNDLFFGPIDDGLATLQSADVIDGGAGYDSLNAELNLPITGPRPTVDNVEFIGITSLNPLGADLDMSNIDGEDVIEMRGDNPLSLSNIKNLFYELRLWEKISTVTVNFLDNAIAGINDFMNISLRNSDSAITINNTSVGSVEVLSLYALTDSSTVSTGNKVVLDGSALIGLRELYIHNNDVEDFNLSTSTGLNGLEVVDASSSIGNVILDLSNITNNLTITGGPGNDSITSGAGADNIVGGIGDDNLSGGGGNDTLTGGGGTDFLTGNSGNDTLVGGDDYDDLYGDGRDDPGDTGADILIGGKGKDFMVGSYFDKSSKLLTDDFISDRFVFAAGDSLNIAWTGWSPTTADHINMGLDDIIDLPIDIISTSPSTGADFSHLPSVSSTGTTANSMTVDIATAVSAADLNAFDQRGDTILFTLTGSSAIGPDSYYILVQNNGDDSTYDASEDTVMAVGLSGFDLDLFGGNLQTQVIFT